MAREKMLDGESSGLNVKEYKPNKATFRGDAGTADYNHVDKSPLAKRKDEKFKDTGKDAGSGPIDTNRNGVLGNTKNVARDPGKSGKNRTPGFGGKEAGDIAKSRRGGLEAARDTGEKGVGEANKSGILGNTNGVARNPGGGGSASARASNVQGFQSGTHEGYVK